MKGCPAERKQSFIMYFSNEIQTSAEIHNKYLFK